MKLKYTQTALCELDDILHYITRQSPVGARRVRLRLRETSELLTRHPESGTQTSVSRIRRMIATPYPYFIYYETTKLAVIVIGVRHAARDPKSMPGVGAG